MALCNKVYGYGTENQKMRTYSILENMWADANLKEIKAKAGMLLTNSVNATICTRDPGGNTDEQKMRYKFPSLAEQFIMYAALADMFQNIPQYYYSQTFRPIQRIFQPNDIKSWELDKYNKICVIPGINSSDYDDIHCGKGVKSSLILGFGNEKYEFSIETVATKYLKQLYESCHNCNLGDLERTGVFYNKDFNSYIIIVGGLDNVEGIHVGDYIVPLFARILKPYMKRDFTAQELAFIKHESQMLCDFQKFNGTVARLVMNKDAMAETQEMMNCLIENLYTEDNRVSLMDIDASKMELNTMMNTYVGLRNKYDRMSQDIQDYQNRLSELRESAADVQQQMEAMCKSIMDYTVSTRWTDLNTFIDKNKNILIEDNKEIKNGNLGFSFYAFGHVQYYDDIQAEKFYNNDKSEIWRYETIDGYDAIPRLFKGIFIDRTIQLNICTNAYVRVHGGFGVYNSSYVHLVENINGKSYLYNPHHYHFSCMGDNERTLEEYIDNHNYIAFISQMVTMAQSINLGDHCVFERFINDLFDIYEDDNLIISTPEGRQLTLRGANQYLINLEESEGQVNEQAS